MILTSHRTCRLTTFTCAGPTFLPSEHDDLPPGVAFLTLSSHRTPITALDFSEPYGTLVTASSIDDSGIDDGSPRVWDLLTVEEIGRLRGHVGTVKALQVEDHVCLTGGEDGAVRVWDLRRVGFEEGEQAKESLGDITEEEEVGAETEDGDGEHPRKRKTNGIRTHDEPQANDSGSCARVLEGHSKAVTALYFEENCLVSSFLTRRLPSLTSQSHRNSRSQAHPTKHSANGTSPRDNV